MCQRYINKKDHNLVKHSENYFGDIYAARISTEIFGTMSARKLTSEQRSTPTFEVRMMIERTSGTMLGNLCSLSPVAVDSCITTNASAAKIRYFPLLVLPLLDVYERWSLLELSTISMQCILYFYFSNYSIFETN